MLYVFMSFHLLYFCRQRREFGREGNMKMLLSSLGEVVTLLTSPLLSLFRFLNVGPHDPGPIRFDVGSHDPGPIRFNDVGSHDPGPIRFNVGSHDSWTNQISKYGIT